jgi:hypothetical protein
MPVTTFSIRAALLLTLCTAVLQVNAGYILPPSNDNPALDSWWNSFVAEQGQRQQLQSEFDEFRTHMQQENDDLRKSIQALQQRNTDLLVKYNKLDLQRQNGGYLQNRVLIEHMILLHLVMLWLFCFVYVYVFTHTVYLFSYYLYGVHILIYIVYMT